VHCLVKGDNLVPAISAASIVAKVHRDAIMTAMHHLAPQYNWASNKGYGARVHRDAILSHGPHPEHRTVFIDGMLQMDLPLAAPPPAALEPARA
jgi:ribonuclease HII